MLCCAVLLQDLLVHCEQQVMRFVLRYLHSTVVEQQDVEDICNQVRSSNGYWTSAATKLTRASHGNKHYDDSVACKQTARGRRTRHKQERTCARMKRDMPGLPTPRPTLLWRPPATHISASAPPPSFLPPRHLPLVTPGPLPVPGQQAAGRPAPQPTAAQGAAAVGVIDAPRCHGLSWAGRRPGATPSPHLLL
jgi:hypothetical protein